MLMTVDVFVFAAGNTIYGIRSTEKFNETFLFGINLLLLLLLNHNHIINMNLLYYICSVIELSDE